MEGEKIPCSLPEALISPVIYYHLNTSNSQKKDKRYIEAKIKVEIN